MMELHSIKYPDMSKFPTIYLRIKIYINSVPDVLFRVLPLLGMAIIQSIPIANTDHSHLEQWPPFYPPYSPSRPPHPCSVPLQRNALNRAVYHNLITHKKIATHVLRLLQPG